MRSQILLRHVGWSSNGIRNVIRPRCKLAHSSTPNRPPLHYWKERWFWYTHGNVEPVGFIVKFTWFTSLNNWNSKHDKLRYQSVSAAAYPGALKWRAEVTVPWTWMKRAFALPWWWTAIVLTLLSRSYITIFYDGNCLTHSTVRQCHTGRATTWV